MQFADVHGDARLGVAGSNPRSRRGVPAEGVRSWHASPVARRGLLASRHTCAGAAGSWTLLPRAWAGCVLSLSHSVLVRETRLRTM